MRSRWEGGRDVDADDAPANLTEREVRAIRRRAGVGVVALLFALVAIAGVGWTLFTGTEGLQQVQSLKERAILGATAGVIVRDEDAPPLTDGQAGLAPPMAADSVSSTAPGAAPGAAPSGVPSESRSAATQQPSGH